MIRDCMREHTITGTTNCGKAGATIKKKSESCGAFFFIVGLSRSVLGWRWRNTLNIQTGCLLFSFFFFRGMQWKGGRLVPGCVDKQNIKGGRKKKKNLPASSTLVSCYLSLLQTFDLQPQNSKHCAHCFEMSEQNVILFMEQHVIMVKNV